MNRSRLEACGYKWVKVYERGQGRKEWPFYVSVHIVLFLKKIRYNHISTKLINKFVGKITSVF